MYCPSAQELVKVRCFAHWPVATKVPCLTIWSPVKKRERKKKRKKGGRGVNKERNKI